MPLTPLNQSRLAMLRDLKYEVQKTDWQVNPGDDISGILENAQPGDSLVLEDGDYTIGRINRCAEGVTVMARNQGRATIKGGSGDTISCMDGSQLGEITFRGLVIEGSSRSAVMTLSEKPPYRMNFDRCVFDGAPGWSGDPDGPRPDTKWLVMIHRWFGWANRCTFKNVYREHGGYIHTPGGDILIHQCRSIDNGRTAWQFVGRNAEAGYADVQVAFVESYFANNGRKDGSTQVTVGGCREAYFQDCEWLLDWAAPYGTGHLLNWSDKMRQDPTDLIELVGTNKFFTKDNCGSAPAVRVVNSRELAVSGQLGIFAGGQNAAEVSLEAKLSLGPFDSYPQIKGAVKRV